MLVDDPFLECLASCEQSGDDCIAFGLESRTSCCLYRSFDYEFRLAATTPLPHL